jgi:hypothetical protein
VNAGEDGIVIFPAIFESPIDPSTPMHDRDVSRLGTGLWNRGRDPTHDDELDSGTVELLERELQVDHRRARPARFNSSAKR